MLHIFSSETSDTELQAHAPSLALGTRDQGALVRERRLQLRSSRVGSPHQGGTLGRPASGAGHLPARSDERGAPIDSRRRPARHRRSYSGMLGLSLIHI